MKIKPDLFKAKHLRIWYDAGGRLNNNNNNNQLTSKENKNKKIEIFFQELFLYHIE